MAEALLDLHDSNLQLWSGEALLAQSPGYALLEGKSYQFGSDARAKARLQPRNVNTRFWWQLSTEALRPALGPARHTADLAHAHLLEIHREAKAPEEWVVAVPGSLQRDQLALLLGIIQQCPFNAVGLVNRSVALASCFAREQRVFHLEVQLHQALLTELKRSPDAVELVRTTPLPGCGMLKLQERLVEKVATTFIRQTRYDPRKSAASEQTLYDELPAVLRQLDTAPEANFELSGYQARINASDLAGAADMLLQSLPDGIDGAQFLLDPLLVLLPSLRNRLGGAELLPADGLRQALAAHSVVQREESLNFITSLPLVGAAASGEPAPEPIPEPPAPPEETTPAKEAPPPAPEPAPAPPAPVAEPEFRPPSHLLIEYAAHPLAALGESADIPGEDLAGLVEQDGHWVLPRDSGFPRIASGPHQAGRILHPGDTLAFSNGLIGKLIDVR